jgi:hypothetical protein
MPNPSPNPTRDRWLAVNFAATIFVSAFLLFQVQPLVSKHILPWFGGSPAVWTACMLFFQALLFAGYLYAHLSQRGLRPAWQAAVQLSLIVAAVVFLRVLPDASWEPRQGGDPVGQILLMLTLTVGLPYFVLSSTAPLIQAWFARAYPGRVPYRLYALSNLGSLLALLSYPLFFERAFDLPQQARIWSWGFVAYAVLCGVAAVRLWGEGPRSSVSPIADSPWRRRDCESWGETRSESRRDSPTWGQRALWLLLPAFATVALLATTNHVCTDIAVMPLLWVVPLALYLLTFIIAFDHPRWYRPLATAGLTLLTIYGAALVSREGLGWVDLYDCGTTGRLLHIMREGVAAAGTTTDELPVDSPQFHVSFFTFLALNFAAMFGVCLLCHGELVRRRPHPRYLTAYYLMIAAGGVLGGVLVTIVAPQVFRTYFEWQIVLFLGCVWAATQILRALVNAAFPSDPHAAPRRGSGLVPLLVLLVLLLPTSLVLVDLVEYLQVSVEGTQLRVRNFFGTLAVREKNFDNPQLRSNFLYHGVTAHGSQFVDPALRGQPATYYSATSGIGRTLSFFRRQRPPGGLRIGSVGLGTGTLAAFVGAGDIIFFYEINQAVVDITEGGRWFTYLDDCRNRGGDYRIKMGDARLLLERELRDGQPQRCHVLALDAFSGDAIPVHLLTEEAFATYLGHLSSAASDGVDGALVVHISNRYLDLEPVVRGLAGKFGLPMVHLHNRRNPDQVIYESEWIVLTRNKELLDVLTPFAAISDEPLPPAILWTDARSNLWDVAK